MVRTGAIILTLFLSPLCFAEDNTTTDILTKEITDLSAAIRLHPNDPQAYRDRAEAFHQRGKEWSSLSYGGKLPCDAYKEDYRRAIADYTQAMRLEPGDTIDYQERATLYLALSDYKKAIADCTEALRIQPGNEKAYQIRLIAYRNQRDYDRAIADCTAQIQLDPANPSRQLWWSERGSLHEAKGDYKQALEDFTKTIRVLPGNAVSYEYRGDYFLRRGVQDNALADYGEAIQFARKIPSSEFWIGDMSVDDGHRKRLHKLKPVTLGGLFTQTVRHVTGIVAQKSIPKFNRSWRAVEQRKRRISFGVLLLRS